jgi:hypothetical protein
MVHRVVLIAALAAASLVSGCGRIYSAAPISARVVDAESGAPIEGVNVVAAWQAKGGLEGGNVKGYVTVMEAVTNANGEFSFPGWGPKWWSNGAIQDGAPLLILFKPGYDAEFLWERKYGMENAPSHMTSSRDGKSLTMKRFDGSTQEYSERLGGILSVVDSLILDGGCSWRSIPRFLLTVDRQHKVFDAAKTTLRLYPLESLDINADKSCGSLKDYVLEHGR